MFRAIINIGGRKENEGDRFFSFFVDIIKLNTRGGGRGVGVGGDTGREWWNLFFFFSRGCVSGCKTSVVVRSPRALIVILFFFFSVYPLVSI